MADPTGPTGTNVGGVNVTVTGEDAQYKATMAAAKAAAQDLDNSTTKNMSNIARAITAMSASADAALQKQAASMVAAIKSQQAMIDNVAKLQGSTVALGKAESDLAAITTAADAAMASGNMEMNVRNLLVKDATNNLKQLSVAMALGAGDKLKFTNLAENIPVIAPTASTGATTAAMAAYNAERLEIDALLKSQTELSISDVTTAASEAALSKATDAGTASITARQVAMAAYMAEAKAAQSQQNINALLNVGGTSAVNNGATFSTLASQGAATNAANASAISRTASFDAQSQAQLKAAGAAARAKAAADIEASQAGEKFLKTLSAQADAAGKTASQLLAEKAASLGVGEQAAADIAKLAAFEKAASGAGHGAVSVSKALRELFVVFREVGRGDITRLPGSLTLLATALLGSTAAVYVGIAAFAALAAAVAATVYEMNKGDQDILDFNNAMAATGKFAGITSSQYQEMAEKIHTETGKSTDSIRDLELQIVRTGKVTGDNVGLMAEDAQLLAKALGEKPQEAMKSLVELSGNTTDAALKLDSQLHFLNDTLLKHVMQLEAAGDKQGAMKAVMEAILEPMKAQEKELTGLDALWRNLGDSIDGVSQRLQREGRLESGKATSDDIIKQAQWNINTTKSLGPVWGDAAKERQQYITDQTLIILNAEKTQNIDKVNAGIAAQKADEAHSEAEATAENLNHEQKRLEIEGRIAQIRSGLKDGAISDKAQAESNIKSLQAQEAALKTTYGRTHNTTADPGANQVNQIKIQIDAIGRQNKAQEALNKQIADGTITSQQAAIQAAVAAKVAKEQADIDNLGVRAAQAKGKAQEALYANQAKLKDQLDAYIDALKRQESLKNEEKIISTTEAIDKQNASIVMQTSLIGKNNEERAIAIAQYATLQNLLANGVDIVNNRDTNTGNALSPNQRHEAQRQLNAAKTGAIDKTGPGGEDAETYTQNAIKGLQDQIAGYNDLTAAIDKTDVAAAAYIKYQELIRAAGKQPLSDAEKERLKAEANVYAERTNLNTVQNRERTASASAYPIASRYSQDKSALKTIEADYAQHMAKIAQDEKDGIITHAQAEQQKTDETKKQNEARLSVASDFFGALAGLTSSSNRTLKNIGKDAAIAEATMSAYEAINKALGEGDWVKATLVGVEAFSNVSKIAAMATGGVVSGPGGPTDDKVLTRLSNGEGVLTAAAMAKNPGVMAYMNAGGSAATISMPNRMASIPQAMAANDAGGSGGISGRLEISVGMNDDGKWEAKVNNIATNVAVSVTKSGLRNYDAVELPKSMARVNKDPRARS